MRALTFHAPFDVRHDSVAEPTLRHPGDALVRVRWAGLCGSDLHPYRGHEVGLDAGTVMGHELVGEVIATGENTPGLAVGDTVVAPFTTSCGECFYCRRGLTCRCTGGALFGWVAGGIGLHGAQAELVRVPLAASSLVKVPTGLDLEVALLCGDVVPTGLFAARAAGAAPGATVAVVGCGPIGLAAVLAARHLGAEVFALDTVPERLALAESLGARPIDASQGDAVATTRGATDGRGVDGAIEAVGAPQATRLAYELLRPGGQLAAAGVHTETHLAISPGEAYDKNLTYQAGRCPARALLPEALELAQTHATELAAVISHRLPLEDGAWAYRMFDQKLEGCTKVVLGL